MASKVNQTNEEIDKLYTDTYRARMPLYNDYVFHRIYGSDTEESHAALIGLLNIILERKEDPIQRIEIKNTVDYGERPEEKDTTMDIKAETDSGELLTIEMQVGHLSYYRNRALFYGGRLVNSSLNSGKNYDKMKKSIVVSIIESRLFSENIPCHSVFYVAEKNTGHMLSDCLMFHFLELGKADPAKAPECMTPIERLAVYLRYANDENYKDAVQEICAQEEGIVMAESIYRRATKDEREAAWAESRLYFQLQQNTEREMAREEGLAEGEAMKQREIAKNMLQEGIATSVIARLTDLPIEEIEKL